MSQSLTDSIRDLFISFTDKTGICVDSIEWNTVKLMDSSGEIVHVQYLEFDGRFSEGPTPATPAPGIGTPAGKEPEPTIKERD